MSEPGAGRSIPFGVLWGAAALVGFTLVSAGAARVGVIGPEEKPASEATATRDLRFKDRSDGAVTVHEAGDDRLVAVLPPGGDGFIRGAMRGLARERRQKEVGPEPPFRLTRWDDGRLSLEETGRGRRIDLGAFGPTNAQAFGRLLTAEAAR